MTKNVPACDHINQVSSHLVDGWEQAPHWMNFGSDREKLAWLERYCLLIGVTVEVQN